MADEKNPNIPDPTRTPITFRGRELTPGHLLSLWRTGQSQSKNSRTQILQARAFRRMELSSMIQLAPAFVRQNPEAASWAQSVMPERVTLERDLIARVGIVEPEFLRNPLGFLKGDDDDAEECEAYLNEWRLQAVPTQSLFGKGVEDGQYGVVVIPATVDMEGCEDFYEYLDERAVQALEDDEERDQYEQDDDDKRKRYVRKDKDGKKKLNPKFDRGNDDASKKAHDEAVQRYLLDKPASVVRLIPALDCVPIFSRGKQRDRWELTALMERTLYYQEELLEQEYSWKGMGDRKLVPLAYNADGSTMRVRSDEVGSNGQLYVYTLYLTYRDNDGHVRPLIAYTVGGSGTTLSISTAEPTDPNSVGLIDLYDDFGIEGPLWHYDGGLHTEDDDPDYYWQPYLLAHMNTIRSIEGMSTAINASASLNSFTGHFIEINPNLPDEVLLESDGDLRRGKVPGPGEIEPSIGRVTPAQQATVGVDAYRVRDQYLQSLQTNTAVDQTQSGGGASGRAQVVASAFGQVAKRHIRDGVKTTVEKIGGFHLKVLYGIAKTKKIRWPLQTVRELPVGNEIREGTDVMVFDPEWLGPGGKSVRLQCDYPAEENLALRDLEMNAAERGFGTMARVAKSMGENDTQRLRTEILKDKMWNMPETVMGAQEDIAKRTGDKRMQKIIALRNAQMLTQGDIPGVNAGGQPTGVPTAALKNGSGRPSIAQMSKGGVMSGEMATAAENADGQAALMAAGSV